MVGAYAKNALQRRDHAERLESQIAESASQDFPCKLTINVPFPTARLAKIAITSLRVDKELSPFVHRAFDLMSSASSSSVPRIETYSDPEDLTVLKVSYSATTNRMLRVSTNGFFESLALVLQCMEELDVDVVMKPSIQSLAAVQGVEAVRLTD